MRKLILGLLFAAAITNPAQIWYTANSGTQRKLSDKLSDVVSVKDFGAKCDGVTDDTTAIANAKAAAIASGSPLVFPGICVNTAPGGNVPADSFAAGFGAGNSKLLVGRTIEPIRPSPTTPLTFPEGDDLLLQSTGSADVHLTNNAIDLTSTTNVAGAGVATISIGSTAGLCIPGVCSIIIEPTSNTNNETISSANWSCTSGNCASSTQITATFAKAHTQPFTVRQIGAVFLDSGQQVNITLPMPTSFLHLTNYLGNDIFKLEQQSNGAASIRYFDQSGTQNGRMTVTGSGLEWIALGGTGTGGFTFEGASTGQTPLMVFRDNATDNHMAFTVNTNTKQVQIGSTTFSSLGTPGAGTISYCSDCTIANPCASGGTGAIAKRLNGVWVCN